MSLLGWIAGIVVVVLSPTFAVPQAAHIWRSRSYLGVTPAVWIMFSLLASVWLGLSIRSDDTVVLLANLTNPVVAGLILIGMARADGWARSRTVPYSSIALGVPWIGLALGLAAPLLVVDALLLGSALIRLPQVSASWRTFRARTVSDVSLPTWWMSAAAATSLTLHGFVVGSSAVVIPSAATALLGLTIIALETGARRGLLESGTDGSSKSPRGGRRDRGHPAPGSSRM